MTDTVSLPDTTGERTTFEAAPVNWAQNCAGKLIQNGLVVKTCASGIIWLSLWAS